MTNRILGLVLTGVAAAALGLAADKPKPAAKAAPDEQAAMEAMMRASTPGENHKKLEAFVGTFDAKVRNWEKPGGAPVESTGTSEGKMVLGGRYVHEDFQGTFMGQPFTGMGMTGYDNVQKKFVSSWADTMGTGIMMSMGATDASGKTLEMSGSSPDPMSGKMMTLRQKMTIADNDHHTFEMWGPGADGKSFKMVEIDYVRRK